MSNLVFIVTDPELGWDCVCAVYDGSRVTHEELRKKYPANQYTLTLTTVETTVESE